MILDDIVRDKLVEIEERKRVIPESEMRIMATKQPATHDFAGALRGPGIRLIAEVKKASPSRGLIRADFDPVSLAKIYTENGAAAISVLTDEKYFQGKPEYLKNIRQNITLPLLRKDFILEPYQVYESRAYGADALLLIVAILTPESLQQLLALSHGLGMKALVEVHNEEEIHIALNSGAQIIGINNRDLKTFKVDLGTTERLHTLVQFDRIVVSESGIKTREDIAFLRSKGVHAVLIGETLMASDDIPNKIKELFEER